MARWFCNFCSLPFFVFVISTCPPLHIPGVHLQDSILLLSIIFSVYKKITVSWPFFFFQVQVDLGLAC